MKNRNVFRWSECDFNVYHSFFSQITANFSAAPFSPYKEYEISIKTHLTSAMISTKLFQISRLIVLHKQHINRSFSSHSTYSFHKFHASLHIGSPDPIFTGSFMIFVGSGIHQSFFRNFSTRNEKNPRDIFWRTNLLRDWLVCQEIWFVCQDFNPNPFTCCVWLLYAFPHYWPFRLHHFSFMPVMT